MKRKNSLQDYDKLGKILHNIDQVELSEFLSIAKRFKTSKECQAYMRLKKYMSELKSAMDAAVCRDYPNFEYATKVFYNRGNRPLDYFEKMETNSENDKTLANKEI
jgi:hypothetical protein